MVHPECFEINPVLVPRDIVPSVKQCASKRNSSRVNSPYMDSTIKEYIKEYYRFLWITPMNLDKPMRYHRNTTEARRHP